MSSRPKACSANAILKEIATLDIFGLRDPPPRARTADRFSDRGQHLPRDSAMRSNLMVHHPFRIVSEESVERFLREAADDPGFARCKTTLYRTSNKTPGHKSSTSCAPQERQGQVAVVLELKARFDEEANIKWASRMERAGIHVTYGVVGLKTHTKITLVVRNDFTLSHSRRYAHIATGNYHAGTARLYTDLGAVHVRRRDRPRSTELFNYLTTGYKPRRKYGKLLVAPKQLKQRCSKRSSARSRTSGSGRARPHPVEAQRARETSTSCARCIARRSAASRSI